MTHGSKHSNTKNSLKEKQRKRTDSHRSVRKTNREKTQTHKAQLDRKTSKKYRSIKISSKEK